MQFTSLPLLFLLARLGYARLGYVALLFFLLCSAAYQLRLKGLLLRWLKVKKWEAHVSTLRKLLGSRKSHHAIEKRRGLYK